MKFFVELKCRTLLVFINFSFILNLVYYYKNCIIYLLIKPFILKQNLNFYLIYTDIGELFAIFYNIIVFISCSFFLLYAIYNILIILKPALYSKEFNYLKFIFMVFILFFYKTELITVILIPFLYNFFEFFENNFILNLIHFEIKLNQYFFVYYLVFKTNVCFFVILIIILLNLQVFRKYKLFLVKSRKFFCIFSLLITAIIINDFFTQLIINFILLFYYELILFLCLIKNKDKMGFEPIRQKYIIN